jgi:hypothetical protein
MSHARARDGGTDLFIGQTREILYHSLSNKGDKCGMPHDNLPPCVQKR